MAAFPWVKMMVLLTVFVSHWIVNYGTTSYLGYMVQHLNIVDDKDKAGYFSGLLSSAYMAGNVPTAFFWGTVGDRRGRLPVISVSLLSTILLSIGFGFSTKFWEALACRFFLGLFNGIMAIMAVTVSDVCGEEHEVVGMGAATMAWSIGVVVGPGLSGILAEPATHYPRTFSESGLFGRFPYLLPNIAVSSWASVSLILVHMFLGETKRLAAVDKSNTNPAGERSCHIEIYHPCTSPLHVGTLQTPKGGSQPSWMGWGETLQPEEKQRSLLAEPRIRLLLFVYFLYMFLHSGFDEVVPLWAMSSVAKGGLDWITPEIGQVLIICGLSICFFELFAIPCITKRIGVAVSNRVAVSTLVPIIAAFPALSRLHDSGGYLYAAVLIVLFSFYTCSNATFLSISLGFNNATEERRRGEMNGIATVVCSLGKTAGPALCSAAFAACINSDYQFPLDYHLFFVAMSMGFLAIAIGGWNSIPTHSLEQLAMRGSEA